MAQHCGTITIFVLASCTGFMPLILYLAASTWLKSGTSLLPFWDEKCSVTTKGTCRMAPPPDPLVIQGLGPTLSRPCLPKAVQMKPKKCVLFLEYSDGFWEEFCSLLDMTKYLFSLQLLYLVVNNGFLASFHFPYLEVLKQITT